MAVGNITFVDVNETATKQPGLGYRFLRTPWSIVVKTRKDHQCWICKEVVAKGSEMTKPMLETPFRYRRICVPCMEERVV